MGADQTSVGDEGWVREWCRSGRGGQLLFWGMKGEVVPGRKGVWRGLTRRGGQQDTLDVARESSAGLIWLVTRGVGGRRGGGGPGRPARGGDAGGTSILGSLKNQTIGLIWLVTGEGTEAWGAWAREAGKGGGEMGQQGVRVPTLTIGLVWLVTRWMGRGAPENKAWGGGVGQGGGQGGGDGGAPKSSVGETRGALVPPFGSLKNLTIGLIWLVTRRGGGGPGRRARGRWGAPESSARARGRWEGGGTRESSVGATRGALVPSFGLPSKT